MTRAEIAAARQMTLEVIQLLPEDSTNLLMAAGALHDARMWMEREMRRMLKEEMVRE